MKNWLSNAYPAIIQFHSLTPREVIKSISCSSRHLLALTHLGSVYSCGEGSDGQLGLNSQRSETSLEHISWFMTSNDQRIIILSVAAGADESSSHSAAIDESGRLYTWGTALLCGHGFVKQPHILCPRLVDSLEVG
jgi:alpha-tubulin suppressor-like RCC1 family protein